MRRTIFEEMRRMQDDMDELFSRLWSDRLQEKTLLQGPSDFDEEKGMLMMHAPQTDVWETENEIHVKLDMPGVEKKDISITHIDGGIEVEAHKTREKEEKDDKKGYYRVERSSIGYKRMVPLPNHADKEKAKAKYKDGVLEIVMPKMEQIKDTKRILIE
jgi:HSP20 family protein